MKKKKIISIVLSLALVISIVATAIIATANAKETDVVIDVAETELSIGQTTTVSVKVTTNYPVATMSIPVFYDKTKIEVSEATATLTDYAVKSAITDAQSVDTAKVYANTGINADEYGFVLVTYIGGAGQEVAETINGEVLTFNVTAKTDVSGTAAIKCVSKSAKTDENVAGMLYFGSPVSGRTINSVPENIKNIDLTKAEANVKVGASEPELLLSEYAEEVGGVYIDRDRCTGSGDFAGCVYGIDTLNGEYLEDYFATPSGEVIIVPTEEFDAEGTGALIELYDDDGNLVETYVFILFGDINGDAGVDGSDISIADAHDGYVEMIEDDTAAFYAADVNFDGGVDGSDISILDAHDGYVEELLSQAEMATNYG